jgi:PAS domain S-box-containing protein
MPVRSDKKELKILMVEDEVADANLVRHILLKAGLGVHFKRVDTRDAFLRELDKNPPDVILSDHGLPSFSGFTALILAREKMPTIPFIFVTRDLDEEVLVRSLKEGAANYISKSTLPRLAPAILEALDEKKIHLQRDVQNDLTRKGDLFHSYIEPIEEIGICLLDQNGFILHWNRGVNELTHFQSDKLTGKHYSIFFMPEEIEKNVPNQKLELTIAYEKSEGEGKGIREDGSSYWFKSFFTLVRDEEKKIVGFTMVFFDISEQKTLVDRCQYQNSKLHRKHQDKIMEVEELDKEMEALSYSISHDLRAPLRHIGGFVTILQESASSHLDANSRGYLKIISDSVKEMDLLIQNLLSYSRMGRIEMHKMQFSLDAVLKMVLKELNDKLANKKIDLVIGKLPNAFGDPHLIRIVFLNIFSNALKFTENRASPKIEIGSHSTSQEVIVYIRDNGIGFDMKYANKLFGVFQKLHSGKEFKGAGIGLANVKRVIRRHGGRVWAEGHVDHGATFYFSLPIVPSIESGIEN